MEIGQIKTCIEYNQEAKANWYKSGTPNNLTCFVWLNNRGNYKRYGFVGKVKKHSVIWRETKKEVMEEMKKEGVR